MLKKYLLILISLLIIIGMAVLIQILKISTNEKGKTSGIVKLFVDGDELFIDGNTVEFSFTDDSNGNRFCENNQLVNGSFTFNKSQYALYFITFSLTPDKWGASGQSILFEIQYFSSYSKAITEFDIRVLVETGKTVELIASEGISRISSGQIPIASTGMKVSVRVPSP